jgi:hypothetical protein
MKHDIIYPSRLMIKMIYIFITPFMRSLQLVIYPKGIAIKKSARLECTILVNSSLCVAGFSRFPAANHCLTIWTLELVEGRLALRCPLSWSEKAPRYF